MEYLNFVIKFECKDGIIYCGQSNLLHYSKTLDNMMKSCEQKKDDLNIIDVKLSFLKKEVENFLEFCIYSKQEYFKKFGKNYIKLINVIAIIDYLEYEKNDDINELMEYINKLFNTTICTYKDNYIIKTLPELLIDLQFYLSCNDKEIKIIEEINKCVNHYGHIIHCYIIGENVHNYKEINISVKEYLKPFLNYEKETLQKNLDILEHLDIFKVLKI